MVLTALTTNHHSGVIRRRRHHAQHFTRRGFDGHDTADFALQQPFTKCLQLIIDTQRQILSRHRFTVQSTILVTALDAPVCIAQQDLSTLHTTQLFLVGALYTLFSDIVARLVVIVFLNVCRRHLCNVSQDMCRQIILILTDTTPLYIETGETEHLLLENTEILIAQLWQEQLLCKA